MKIICGNLVIIRNKDTNQDINQQKHSKHKRRMAQFNTAQQKYFNQIRKILCNPVIDPHFQKNHICNSILNCYKTKVSIFCMQNIKSVLSNYKMKILSDTTDMKESCNCRNKNDCPLEGLTLNIIIPATYRRKDMKIFGELSIADENSSFFKMVCEVRKMKLV